MLNDFLNQVKKEKLFLPQHKILLAVSGGMDSVVMARLYKELSFVFAIAHCNFKLRGIESDRDEEFVRFLARESGVEFFAVSFDTDEYASTRKISIQMAARELRYNWLEEIRNTHGFDYIATAHHMDDQAETVLMNIIRGTGLDGLQGIKMKNGCIIRPLLNFTRKQIADFCHERGLKYREDSSNLEEKYIRNRIRHTLMPFIKEINPSADDSLVRLGHTAGNASKLLNHFLEREMHRIVDVKKQKVVVDISQLITYPGFRFILFEILKPYDFQPPVIEEIAASRDAQPGKIFLSATHQCVKDRDHFIITPIRKKAGEGLFTITKADEVLDTGDGKLVFTFIQNRPVDFSKGKPEEVYFDFDKLEYPLVLRHPLDGDYFIPHGMSGKKKISDFLTDKKIPLTEKRNIWLLCSGEEIAWVVGFRPDERYKITSDTKTILKVNFISQNK